MALGNRSLQEYVNGATVGSAIAFVGTYSPSTATTLSYDLNTTTGAISNVSFGGSTASYTFTTPATFLSSYTASADIGGSSGAANGFDAQFTSFSVSEIAAAPEPSEYALFLSGALALWAVQLHRRKKLS
jgi:hypothetical protein